MMADPELIMLDEPSLGLSPLLTATMFEIIEGLHRAGSTILLVEQNVAESLALCDRAYVLENGEIVLAGSGAQMLDDPRVRQAYLGL
jgi:branched-chain amino acid transport system ATP-binding protein